MRTLERQELADLIEGCAILGTGGGGSPREGIAMLDAEREAGRAISIVSLEEVPDDALLASPYMCGSLSPEPSDHPPRHAGRQLPPEIAFRELETFLGRRLYGVIPTEIGGGNTAVALATAARMGIPTVDADPAGRSVPELQHTTFFIKDIPIAPLAVASGTGDVVIMPRADDDLRVEAIVRAVAVACGGHVGVADHPVTGRTLRDAIVPGTLSQALAIGTAVRRARESSEDPVQAALTAGNGYLLFSGIVERAEWNEDAGFTVGEITIAGSETFGGSGYKLWYKNEYMVAWLNGVPDVTAPDLICLVDASGKAITNPNCQAGMDVAVIGYPAPGIWRSERGVEALGPQHFGFDIPYTPIEQTRRGGDRP